MKNPQLNKFGTKAWYDKDGRLHRVDGPAVEFKDGEKRWCKRGELHREDGPAVERPDGSKSWYLNGKRHRADGPAIISTNNTFYWFLHNQMYCTKEEWFEALSDKQKVAYMFTESFAGRF